MFSWPFMACDEMRKRHLNDRINAFEVHKKRKKEHRIIKIEPTDDIRKFNTFVAICIRKCVK